jgi:glycine cleavage system H protein
MKAGKKPMPEWRTIRIRQELVVAAKRTLEKNQYQSLSEFVSEAIRLRLDELKQPEKIAEKQIEYPLVHERLLYTPNHMWIMVTPEGNTRVGLSDYAQRHLRGIASIQTDPIGSVVKKKESFGVVETWMFMFDLYSPISGKIIKLNKTLQDEPYIVNKDPYEAGWIAEIKPNNLIALEEELRNLMKQRQYKTWVSKLGRPRILAL